MRRLRAHQVAALTGAALVIAACGGGEDDDLPPPIEYWMVSNDEGVQWVDSNTAHTGDDLRFTGAVSAVNGCAVWESTSPDQDLEQRVLTLPEGSTVHASAGTVTADGRSIPMGRELNLGGSAGSISGFISGGADLPEDPCGGIDGLLIPDINEAWQ